MAFTKKELIRQASDPRKIKTLRQSRPEESIAGKELAKIVAKRTGYQIKQTTEIVDALFDVIFETLLDKKQVQLTKIGSIMPKVKRARKGINFNRGTGKPPETIIVPPLFKLEFIPNKNLAESMRKLKVSAEEVENLYVDSEIK